MDRSRDLKVNKEKKKKNVNKRCHRDDIRMHNQSFVYEVWKNSGSSVKWYWRRNAVEGSCAPAELRKCRICTKETLSLCTTW
jgi:hypothetical protein